MSYGAIIEDDNENRESIVVITTEEGNDEGAVVPLTSSDALLAASPKIKYLYEKMDGSKIAKTGYSGLISLGMALYSYRKEKVEGDISTAISSAVVSLACNILVSYEFCLKSPFLAASVLSEIRKKPGLSLAVMAALASAGSSAAQVIQGQSISWAALIGSTTFINIASTNLTGLIDNDRSLLKNLAIGGAGLAAFFPVAAIWMSDTARFFSAPSIPKMISDRLGASEYASGTAVAAFGAMGSFIEVLFFCQAIKGIPAKTRALYNAWRDLIEKNLGLGPKASAITGGILALMTASCLGYVGYYAVVGYYVAVSSALSCSSRGGELCWLSNALNLSVAAMDFIATVQQIGIGMINTSAIIPVFTKLLEAATVKHSGINNSEIGSDRGEQGMDQAPSISQTSNSHRSRLALCCCPRYEESQPLIDDDDVPALQAS